MAPLAQVGRSPGLSSSLAFGRCRSDLDGLHGSRGKLLARLEQAVRSYCNGLNVWHELADGSRRQLDMVQVGCFSRTQFTLALQG